MQVRETLFTLVLSVALTLGCGAGTNNGQPDASTDTSRQDSPSVTPGQDVEERSDQPTVVMTDTAFTPDVTEAGAPDTSLDASVTPDSNTSDVPSDAVEGGTGDAPSADGGPRPQLRSCPSGTLERGCGLRTIQGGEFQRGEMFEPSASANGPRVRVSRFQLDTFEVTVARFRRYWNSGHPEPSEAHIIPYSGGRVLGWNGGLEEPRVTSGCTWSPTEGVNDDRPINCLNWATLQAFCVWDNERLPTETELEWAASGGDSRLYPWGSSLADSDMYACWSGGAFRRSGTCRVGGDTLSREGPMGLYDLAGNVWEFTADWHQEFTHPCWRSDALLLDPLCTTRNTDDTHGVRGGGWGSGISEAGRDGRSLRVHTHLEQARNPTGTTNDTGGRCAANGS